jgi:RND family efflux transporter MFP subunit
MGIITAILAFFGLYHQPTLPPPPIRPDFVVRIGDVADEKAVFATVESVSTVPARARIGGTVATLAVKQGDWVEKGQLIALVGDPKLALQAGSYQAQVGAARAQLGQAALEFDRAKRLIAANAISKNDYDKARTAYDVARSNVGSLSAQKAVVLQQSHEGQVLAPTAGRVITVPLLAGSVVVNGDTVATIAEQNFVLRLKVPETHAHHLKAGDAVHFDGADIGLSGLRSGKISLIYPDIESGHVVIDAEVQGLADYFVGERVRVFVPVGKRKAIVVPAKLIVTRSGIDYVKLLLKDGSTIDVPVQRGAASPGGTLEILSGLIPGDKLMRP